MPKAPSPSGKSVYDIRRENLARLTAGEGRKTQLAIKLGVSQARVSHMLKEGPSGRRITTDQARELEKMYGLPTGAMDHDPSQPLPALTAEMSMELMMASIRLATTAAAELDVSLDAATTAELVGTIYDMSMPGELLTLPVVKQLVKRISTPR